MKKRLVASFPSGYDLVTPGDLNAARTTHPLHPSLPLVLSSVLRVVSLPLSGAHLAYSP